MRSVREWICSRALRPPAAPVRLTPSDKASASSTACSLVRASTGQVEPSGALVATDDEIGKNSSFIRGDVAFASNDQHKTPA